MKSFDQYMESWCCRRGIRYTRYCDDMTFSGSFDAKELKNKVKSYLQVMGFQLNEKKDEGFEKALPADCDGDRRQ